MWGVWGNWECGERRGVSDCDSVVSMWELVREWMSVEVWECRKRVGVGECGEREGECG